MRAVLWCNGSIPTESVVEWVLKSGAPVFGVDGGAEKAHGLGVEVAEVAEVNLQNLIFKDSPAGS